MCYRVRAGTVDCSAFSNWILNNKKNHQSVDQKLDGSPASVSKRKSSPFQEDRDYEGGKRMKYLGPILPEEIWCHIHSLMSMRDAARAACISHAFLRSWRCHPNLTFSRKILCMNENVRGWEETAKDLSSQVDQILMKHSGTGMKKFKLEFYNYNVNASYLDRWLQIAVTPAIEELTVQLPWNKKTYNFPWSLLSNGSGNLIRYLNLSDCALRPTVRLSLRSLTGLHLCDVRITEDELACLLHNSFALEQLKLKRCLKIISLKISRLMQRLSYLEVFECNRLQAIESDAQHLSSFTFVGHHHVRISLGQALQLKRLDIECRAAFCYARAELPSSAPNLETLFVHSRREMVSIPMMPSKFSLLKHLSVDLVAGKFPRTYDYCSVISFFDASPSLETFYLNVSWTSLQQPSIFADDPSDLRQMPEYRHNKLKRVTIVGFSSAKSLVELACHILVNTTSLEYITLDTTEGHCLSRCSVNKFGECFPIGRDIILESRKALLAIRTYIEGAVPSKVKLTVVEPCSRCHVV